MKKTILLICGLLLFIPCIIFADMGAPGTESYKATVTNRNGAVYETTDGEKKVLKYGATITVTYEQDGKAYFEDGEVNISDITAIEKNYTLKEKEWTEPDTGIVLKKIELRKGPAAAYESTGISIEPYTTVTIRNQLLQYETSWVYVEYNGNKGFVDSYGGTITVGEGGATLVAYTDTDIYDATTEKAIGKLKANSVIAGKYHYLDMWSRSIYIERPGFKGVINRNDLADNSTGEIYIGKLKRDVKLYDSISMDDANIGKALKTLKKGTVIQTNIYYQANGLDILYYEDGNTKGWIYDIEISSEDENYDKSEYGYAFEYDEKLKTDKSKNYVLKENIVTDMIESTSTTDPTTDPTTPEVIEPNQNQETKREIPYERLFMGVVVALILCITALITVILVNRKKK